MAPIRIGSIKRVEIIAASAAPCCRRCRSRRRGSWTPSEQRERCTSSGGAAVRRRPGRPAAADGHPSGAGARGPAPVPRAAASLDAGGPVRIVAEPHPADLDLKADMGPISGSTRSGGTPPRSAAPCGSRARVRTRSSAPDVQAILTA
jgi:hypothetical protein